MRGIWCLVSEESENNDTISGFLYSMSSGAINLISMNLSCLNTEISILI